MITAYITMTSKGYHHTERWYTFANEKMYAPDMQAMKVTLKERYGKSWRHKVPMYREKKHGATVQAGWVVGFRSWSYKSSHGPRHAVLQQDWISFSECNPIEWDAKC